MSETCVSCKDESRPIKTHCIECGAALCAGHIFECRKCDKPMCIACWRKSGKDFCKACNEAKDI
jgi:hypothetical protein